MQFDTCENAVKYFEKFGESDAIVIADNKSELKCQVSSICQMSGTSTELFACLTRPLSESTTVFSYMHGKTSGIRIKQ